MSESTVESISDQSSSNAKNNPGRPGIQIKVPIIWLLLVQLALGFEWLVSALDKIISPNYPIEFGKQISDFSSSLAFGVVTDTIKNSVLPSYSLFSYLLEYSELVIAIALLSTAALSIFRGDYKEEIRRILIPALLGGILIATFSLLLQGLPESPPLSSATPDIFIILIQLILLIAYFYVYSDRAAEKNY